MKHLLLLLDGLAGDGSPDLDDRTPLEVAERPTLDAMTTLGRPAAIDPDPWGGAVAAITESWLLGLLVGLDPAVDPLGAAVLAAAAREGAVESDDDDDAVLLALDLVTIEDGVLLHADAGGLTDAEGRAIATALSPLAADLVPGSRVRPGVGHRLVLRVPRSASPDPLGLVPPASAIGCDVSDALPAGEGARPYAALVEASAELLPRLEIVQLRRDAGLPAPTHVWPWGAGRSGRRLDLAARYEQRTFAVVGRGESEAGFAALAGLPLTAPASSDPIAFTAAVLEAFEAADAVIAWWRPPVRPDDPAGRAAAATAADTLVAGPLRAALAERHPEDWRMAVLAGPSRSVADGRLLGEPLMAAFEGVGFHGPLELPFVEASAAEAELRFRAGDDLLDYLLFGAGIRRPRRPRRRRSAGERAGVIPSEEAGHG